MKKTLNKIAATQSQIILDRYEPSEAVKMALLERSALSTASPKVLIDHLLEHKAHLDLIQFLAHALPKRESIWWSYIAVESTKRFGADQSPSTLESAALRCSESWLKSPSETLRRKAESLAKLNDLSNASSWVAQAVFWSGGSLTGENEPVLQPPPFLYAHAVYGAIALATASDDPEVSEQRQQHVIAQGLDIAKGGKGLVDLSPSSTLSINPPSLNPQEKSLEEHHATTRR